MSLPARLSQGKEKGRKHGTVFVLFISIFMCTQIMGRGKSYPNEVGVLQKLTSYSFHKRKSFGTEQSDLNGEVTVLVRST